MFLQIIYLDSACVRLEASGGVLGGHSTLDGTAVQFYLILTEAHLRQQLPLRYLNLTLHQIYPKTQKKNMLTSYHEILTFLRQS